jgi:hypothetical protein
LALEGEPGEAEQVFKSTSSKNFEGVMLVGAAVIIMLVAVSFKSLGGCFNEAVPVFRQVRSEGSRRFLRLTGL